jgi:hypothetical protein
MVFLYHDRLKRFNPFGVVGLLSGFKIPGFTAGYYDETLSGNSYLEKR